MKLKKFYGKDVRAAMSEVRKSLGDDAVILANHVVPGGVEIVCAIDYDPNLYENTKKQYQHVAIQKTAAKTTATKPQGESITWLDTPSIVSIQQEIANLKGLLGEQLKGLAWQKLNYDHPEAAMCLKKLYQLGFSNALSMNVLSAAQQSSQENALWQAVIQTLTDKIQILNQSIITGGGVHAFWGATGSGKTTTLNKLALQAVQELGAKNVAIISLDHRRLGQNQQCQAFAKVADISLKCCNHVRELGSTLVAFRSKQLVLLDIPGMGQWDIQLREMIQALQKHEAISHHLLLPCQTELSVLQDIVKAHHDLKLTSVILSKVDEATTLGRALSVAIEHGLPLSYFADGQRLLEDLHFAQTQVIVKKMFAIAKQQQYEEDEYQLAGQYSSTQHQVRA